LTVPMEEKMHVLTEIATGLAELHSAGIVHGDIKPENILLSDHKPRLVRLADFGLSSIRQQSVGGPEAVSTLALTNGTRGTPIYCAPEMLMNPYKPWVDNIVSKSTRKTDMYAFGVLAWEVIVQQRPFRTMISEAMLCSAVHQGARPLLSDLPADTPGAVRRLITGCWDADRGKRHSALEAASLLQQSLVRLERRGFDVCLSHSDEHITLVSHLFHYLTQSGASVYGHIHDHHSKILSAELSSATSADAIGTSGDSNYDGSWTSISESEGEEPRRKELFRDAVTVCPAVVVCLDQSYQNNEDCMAELRLAAQEGKALYLILIGDGVGELRGGGDGLPEWCSKEVQTIYRSIQSAQTRREARGRAADFLDLTLLLRAEPRLRGREEEDREDTRLGDQVTAVRRLQTHLLPLLLFLLGHVSSLEGTSVTQSRVTASRSL
jgi:hypothetical protein